MRSRLTAGGARLRPRVLLVPLRVMVLAVVFACLLATPAQAQVTYLCSSYGGCRSENHPDAGYRWHRDMSYWSMGPGHNCTNYVAYRIQRNGGPAIRPWVNNGNAEFWKRGAKTLRAIRLGVRIDRTPAVGSVAWYSNKRYPHGHVMYVEKVVGATIYVSEDNWGGTFHWKRITRGSGTTPARGWPEAFLHIHDVKLRGTS